MTAVLVPIGEYKAARLREGLAALAWCDWHPHMVEHVRRLWGATDAEAWAVVRQLRGRDVAT